MAAAQADNGERLGMRLDRAAATACAPPPPAAALAAQCLVPVVRPFIPALTAHFNLQWEDPHGRQRLWECAERSTRRGAIDGVAIVAKVGVPVQCSGESGCSPCACCNPWA